MPKTVQIPEGLFLDLCYYHLLDNQPADRIERICRGLDEKLEAITRRELYGKYKKGDEQARLEYLNRIGMHQDWRY